jgi:hypothetical protein
MGQLGKELKMSLRIVGRDGVHQKNDQTKFIVPLFRSFPREENKIGKVYSLKNTKISKAFFTPSNR